VGPAIQAGSGGKMKQKFTAFSRDCFRGKSGFHAWLSEQQPHRETLLLSVFNFQRRWYTLPGPIFDFQRGWNSLPAPLKKFYRCRETIPTSL